jgi:hypothetical protein
MEALTRLGESRSLAAGDLAAANDHVDIERIELDAPTDAAGRLRSYEGRSGAEERVDLKRASRPRFWAVAARRNSSVAPFEP